jgi:hypothetical protein
MGKNGSCDLCGLDIDGPEFNIKTHDRLLRFCCEGCLGIYRMLNEVDEIAGPPDRKEGVALEGETR